MNDGTNECGTEGSGSVQMFFIVVLFTQSHAVAQESLMKAD